MRRTGPNDARSGLPDGSSKSRRTTFLALAVLDEAIDQARRGRVQPSPGLRLALAYLYAIGDRRNEGFDREPYDEFWRLATQRDAVGSGADGYGRRIHMTAAYNGIERAAGVASTPNVSDAIRRLWSAKPSS